MRKVSVIIPVYNGEKFISQSIDSVLKQTYEPVEIVIINDSSTDNTEKIIFENFNNFLNKKIIYHKNNINRERAYSRNLGVELSTGDYIFFLDYDDLWKKTYIEQVISHLKSHDIIYSFPRTFIDENNQVLRISKKTIPHLGEMIFSGLIGYPSATAIKKEKYIKYMDKYLIREDWEFFIRAYLNDYKIKILDNNQILMREHTGRTSRNQTFYKATLKVFYDYYEYIPEKFKSYFLFHTGETCLRFGDLILGWKLILKSLSINPLLVKDKRKLISLLKRGFRLDKTLRFKTN